MGEIGDKEVESLGRALACHHGRLWATMPAEVQGEADPNSSRKSWLGRARVILEAVHHAMIAQMKREYVIEKKWPRSPRRGDGGRKARQSNKRPQVPADRQLRSD
jgi:hypothetical protein